MKSFIKKIANTNFGINLRNLVGFRPVSKSVLQIKETSSISDAFCWRTDNGYKTTFKYSDILDLFYKIKNSYVQIVFFSKDNEIIKEIIVKNLNYSNELLIDKELLNGLEDYGVFYIYHRFDGETKDNLIISNRCYIGFSFNNCLSSFVHGNSYVRYQDLKGHNQNTNIVKTTFFCNQIYRIQNFFTDFTKSELFISNPTSKKINFSIDNKKYSLKYGHSRIIDVSDKENISIKSNCLLLRPIIFNYRNNYFDVYHG